MKQTQNNLFLVFCRGESWENKMRSHHKERSHLNCQPKSTKISTTAPQL
ncbi:MAG: hypothetical protein WBV73_22760 [Phormidium sp.]